MRKQVTIYFNKDKSGPKMDLLIYLPAGAEAGALLLSLGFSGNNLAVKDPGVKVGQIWDKKQKQRVPATGGFGFGGLNVLPVLDKGFGIATFNYSDIDPDALGGVPFGVRGQYLKPEQTEPAPDEWGAIGGLGVGLESRHGLPRNRQGRGRQAGGHHGCFAAGQDGALGRCPRYPIRHGYCQLFW